MRSQLAYLIAEQCHPVPNPHSVLSAMHIPSQHRDGSTANNVTGSGLIHNLPLSFDTLSNLFTGKSYYYYS